MWLKLKYAVEICGQDVNMHKYTRNEAEYAAYAETMIYAKKMRYKTKYAAAYKNMRPRKSTGTD